MGRRATKQAKRERKMLRVEAAARDLGVSKQEVRGLIEEGKLHAVDVGSGEKKYWRIFASSVARYKEGRKS